jgi:hypothetical protein
MEELRKSVRERTVILFVGAGVSMNLGLPSWEELICRMGAELGYDPQEFIRFGHYQALAEYYRICKGDLAELARWMDGTWHRPPGEEHLAESRIHELIVRLDFPILYTTNYDRWLEKAFALYGRPFVKIVTVNDLVRVREGIPQIIKYHGDFDDPATLILNEVSFFERLEFESPLDIKLRSDSLARSVLFIGYSLSDINLRLLFYRLSRLWGNFPDGQRPRSYLFSPVPNPVQEAVLARWGITMITPQRDDPGNALLAFLETLGGEDQDLP